MKSVFRNTLISVLALSFLCATMAATFTSTALQPHLVITPASPPLEHLTSVQVGAYHRCSTEEIGRTMLPRARTVLW